jgi:hypothetical protein
MGDDGTFMATTVGLSLLAKVAGLDLWDFMEQIGESIPGTTLTASPSDADSPGPGHGPAPVRPRRQAADVVTDHVAAVAGSLDLLAECEDRPALLGALADVLLPGPVATAAAPFLASATESLLPVSRALAAAPATQWWWDLPDLGHQRSLGGAGQPARGAALTEALRAQGVADAEEERRAAREWPWPPPRDTVYSGNWWSPPLGGGVFTSTGPVGPLPAVAAGLALDSIGEDRFELWDVKVRPQARIWNIAGPDDWGRLAARYPRDVTASRRHDWYRFTGRDGPWLLPDWSRAADDWDGVHLSIAGFISAAWLAIPAGDAATVLAGWGPDETLWLNDVFASADRVGTWTGTPGPEAFPDMPLPWLGPR